MGQQSQSQQSTSSRASVGSGLDDLSYDLVTILHQKAKGMEAYEKYARDAQGDPEVSRILDEIREHDMRAIDQLKECVARLLGGEMRGENEPTMNARDTNRSSTV